MENNEKSIDDEIIDQLIKRVTEMEKKAEKIQDYTPHFEALKEIFKVFLVRYNKESAEQIAAIAKMNIAYPAEQIQKQQVETRSILEAIRKALPIKLKYSLDFKSKGVLIALAVIFIYLASATGLIIYLWKENTHLEAVEVKFRMIKQVAPEIGLWADTTYLNNPGLAEKMVTKFESEEAAKKTRAKIRHTYTSK
ncbi:hypothetical protein DIU31_006255 [Mucilaginibacter rubeus]|uniref:Uncharacterized protein n=1 Tax=Mucilaginibacter rubeus TaxID=2027860 RepID=A0AAE6JD49_9SPHI|nr:MULTISPECIES: hypothetical protein [Mucilaginibacter]QEM03143.1 hypothetical protein DIU31_006255 [Mucilaginibacter rubeus]QEM15762.1 hypothetical protein DIU38_006330 [Mucilaginibacter gossypii]QTE41498.1 hypothetical protein J3L19_21445 [Mucilaginibacter rubeus]QTE48103.1 hypothetical protein J3L21_21440 [Mucilaginibacter rubeus]QTE59495.1 hypothetical protein J3L23_13095 [Mucilaginibacter rubeus]